MYTVCFFLYFSLRATVPDHANCTTWDKYDTKTALESCARVNREEPYQTCVAEHVGPTKWFITYRKLKD